MLWHLRITAAALFSVISVIPTVSLAQPHAEKLGLRGSARPYLELAPCDGAVAPSEPIIGAVRVRGAEAIGEARIAQVYEPFLGEAADVEVLQRLTRTVADFARAEGYVFATARVPPQALRLGVLTIDLDLGGVDEVRLEGSSNAQARRMLDPIRGPAPRRADIERRLLLVGDIPGLTVAGTRYLREDGKGVLVVTLNEKRREISLGADNFGPRSYGPVRLQTSVGAHGLVRAGDILSAQLLVAPDSNELIFAAGRYAATFGDGSVVAGLAGAVGASSPSVRFTTADLEGDTRYASIFASKALLRSRKTSLWLNGELASLDVRQSAGKLVYQKDRTLTLAVGLSSNTALGKGRLSTDVEVVRGLAGGGVTRASNPLRSRRDGDAVFTRATVRTVWRTPVGENSSLRLGLQGQVASRALPASQEMGLGGPSSGRAYDYSERFGDEAIIGAVELSRQLKAPRPLQRLEAYAFADAGRTWEKGVKLGDGDLASAGLGLRMNVGRASIDAAVAQPFGGDRYMSADRSPRLVASLRWTF